MEADCNICIGYCNQPLVFFSVSPFGKGGNVKNSTKNRWENVKNMGVFSADCVKIAIFANK